MTPIRTSMFRSQALRPLLRAAQPARIHACFATQDYGSGEGNPVGERPQEQGKNPKSHLEHPGPEAPKVGGEKTSQSQPKKSGDGHTQDEGGPKKGARPKILDDSLPEESESTRKHNEEMKNRYDSPASQIGKK